MRDPIYVRSLTDAERERVAAGLRSTDRFTLRRCQIIQASARGESAARIARCLGCAKQTVVSAIHDFDARGLAALTRLSSRPHTTRAAFDAVGRERLREMLHQSPRLFGKPSGLWTLELAAEVAFETGLTAVRVSAETIRATLGQMGVRWQRAKQWITSPDPQYARKKGARDRLIRWAARRPEWALGFLDEVWWSRLARPCLHCWAEAGRPLRLVEQAVAKDDPDPKALACYGLYLRAGAADEANRMWLRFVDGQPVSGITTQFLAWCCAKLAAEGKRALLLIWDNASWHVSKEVRAWIREHNRRVKRTGEGVRIVACYLPTKSPWLNAIEPKWVHGKRAVVEPDRLLTAAELIDRICAYYDCPCEPHLSLIQNVA